MQGDLVYCARLSSFSTSRSHHRLVRRDVRHAVISYGPHALSLSHFRLALDVGNVPVPLSLLALPLLVQAGLGLLTLLLGLWQSLLAQLAGERPSEGQAAAVGHIGELFGTVRGCVGFVDVVKAVVVHLVEAVLQRQDRSEAVAPLDLAADVGTPRLARHAWTHNATIMIKSGVCTVYSWRSLF